MAALIETPGDSGNDGTAVSYKDVSILARDIRNTTERGQPFSRTASLRFRSSEIWFSAGLRHQPELTG